jgi:hypothetical protein
MTCGVYNNKILGWVFNLWFVVSENHILDIFVNCNWVVTRWQKYSTHLHTNNT